MATLLSSMKERQQVVITRKHHQDFPPVFMNGHKLDISSSITQFGLSISSNLTWERLINNSNLTNSLQSLSHRRLVADLSTFYRYFHGNCPQEIKNINPDPVMCVRTTRSSTYSHPFQVFPELLNCGTHYHPLLSLNPTICHLLNLKSTNLILSPFLLKLPLNFSVFPLSGLCCRPYGLSTALFTKIYIYIYIYIFHIFSLILLFPNKLRSKFCRYFIHTYSISIFQIFCCCSDLAGQQTWPLQPLSLASVVLLECSGNSCAKVITHSLICSLTHSLIRSLTHSIIH